MSKPDLTLRALVFTALRNAAANGYPLCHNDAAEAVDLLDTDADVEAYANVKWQEDSEAKVAAVATLVAEWRGGART